MFKNVLSRLVAPFEKHFAVLILSFILVASTDIYFFVAKEYYYYTLYIVAHGICLAYLLTLLMEIRNAFFKYLLLYSVVTVATIVFLLNVCSLLIMESRLSDDFLAAILGTNKNEMGEFFYTFFTIKKTLLLLGIILMVCSLCYLLHKMELKIKGRGVLLCCCILFISIVLTVHNRGMYKDVVEGRVLALFTIKSPPDLHVYFTNPEIERITKHAPSNTVLIIGESFARTHSSLYGYEKETNPYLSFLADSSNLYVFRNVTSAMMNTCPSFECMMSTYKPEYGDSIKWYTCITLQEVLSLAGYKTYWISNQSKHGLFDNIVGKYADLCSENYFVGNKFAGLDRHSYDEEVLSLTKPLINDEKNNFYVIHLMGSHFDFSKRFPSSFKHFTPSDYIDNPSNQRNALAEYDNSILYNDSVVHEIIHLFEGKEALVIYTSDHGLDVFQSSPEYVGHGKIENPISEKCGKEIPFIIYATPQYAEKYPEVMHDIEKNTNKFFRTDDLIYTIMDVIGIKFKNNDDVRRYSLLSDTIMESLE